MQRESLLIAFEGPDGSGKNTQAKALQKNLQSLCQIPTRIISFPQYNLPTGDGVGKMLHGEYGEFNLIHPRIAGTMFAVDRLAAMPEIIAAQMRGESVVFDRWSESNIHQAARLEIPDEQDVLMAYFRWLEHTVMRLPRTNVTILLDVSHEVSMENARQRAKAKRVQQDQVEIDARYLQRASYLYRKIASENPDSWLWIRCMADETTMKGEAEIQHEIMTGLKRHKILPE